MGEEQPGAESRLGTSMFGSILFTPGVSPPNPGVNGTPLLASNTPPTCHPLTVHARAPRAHLDRKSTRLNSSHGYISYAVFCLKKKHILAIRSSIRLRH